MRELMSRPGAKITKVHRVWPVPGKQTRDTKEEELEAGRPYLVSESCSRPAFACSCEVKGAPFSAHLYNFLRVTQSDV